MSYRVAVGQSAVRSAFLLALAAGGGTVWAENRDAPMNNEATAALAAAANHFRHQLPQARLYTHGSRITRLYGAALATGQSPQDSAERFRRDHAAALGSAPAELRPPSGHADRLHVQPLMYQPIEQRYKFSLVYYAQFREDIPVFRGDLRLLIRHEADYPIVLAASNIHELGGFVPQVRSIDALVFERGKRAVLARHADMIHFTQPELVIWAGFGEQVAPPVVGMAFIGDNGRQDTAIRRWLFIVDARSGDLLFEENQIHEVDVVGNVSGRVTGGVGADICELETILPMPYAEVSTAVNMSYTDADGDFVIENDGAEQITVESPVRGQFFRVYNFADTDTVLVQDVVPPGPADFLHNGDNHFEWIRAETNGYFHANVVRDAILSVNPLYPTISTQGNFSVNVNQTGGICPGNAQYTGDAINFCRAGGASPNTAWSSVIYHEYGHHVVATGGSGQGEYGEGMGDVISITILDDPRVGLGLYGSCGSWLRSADNDCQYLISGCSTCGSQIHDCGQLLSGCVWDTRNELAITEPEDYQTIVLALAVNSVLLHSGTGITPQITIDWLTLDDDDANIGNGTPHRAEICAGFGAHNMPCPPLDAVSFQYPNGRPEWITPDQETALDVHVDGLSEEPVPDTGTMSYRLGSAGEFVTVPMTQSAPNEYQANLPAVTCQQRLDYYFSVDLSGGGTVSDPPDAPAEVFTAFGATGSVALLADDFEDDLGWTVGAPDDDATTGIWNRMDPQGTAAQPENDHTEDPGTACWVTDGFAGSDLGSFDVDGGKTTLISPQFDASQGTTLVSYWRWYSNDSGAAPNSDTFVVDVSNDDGASWVNVETVGPAGAEVSGGWFFHEFVVGDVIPGSAAMRLRFVASDEGLGSLVEAAVDDFTVELLECLEPPACPADLNEDNMVDAADLALMLGAWGPNPGGPADLNDDGSTDAADLALLLGAWGDCL